MVDINKIKLIIWDLDETLWRGTLSEGEIQVNDRFIEFIDNTLDAGIIHSICSKNQLQQVTKKLEELNILEKFVFISVNWEAKGNRIKQMIQAMSLRPNNVLFIDDNIQNLNEVVYYVPEIMTILPNEMSELLCMAETMEKKDIEHLRWKQYKLLEQKWHEQEKYSSNEEFLCSSRIRVEIKNDCIAHLERITELVERSNQLNYTKCRQNREELKKLIIDSTVDSGYITVSDRFGEYGIVGFYAIRNGHCIHFLFSCRTLGMRVEQFVYMYLGCPRLEIVGDVVANLNCREFPEWINQCMPTENEEKASKQVLDNMVLMKGPCDLEQTFSFIEMNDRISTEFSYVSKNGMLVEGHNHTAQILTGLTISQDRKKRLIDCYSWFDSHMFESKIIDKKFGVIVFSMLTDGALGVYRKRETGEMVALCSAYYDLTNPDNWDLYLNNKIPHCDIPFELESLKRFSEEFEWLDNSKGEITLCCLQKIYEILNLEEKTLILLLGSEKSYNCGEIKYREWTTLEYLQRNIVHQNINKKLKQWASGKENVHLIRFDSFIRDDRDFLDTINHFVKRVYFELAGELAKIINSDGEYDVLRKGKDVLLKTRALLFFERHPRIYYIIKPIIKLVKVLFRSIIMNKNQTRKNSHGNQKETL